MIAYGRDLTHDLVTRHQRVNSRAPFAAGLVNIGMAYATIEDLDLYIVRTNRSSFQLKRRQRRSGILCSISICKTHTLKINR